MKSSEKKWGLKSSEIKAIQNVLISFPKIEEVVLYRSRAKGNYRPGSDIDLSLKGENLNYSDLVAIENSLEALFLPYTIDLSLYELIENPDLIEHIDRVGIKFYVKIKEP